MAPRYFQVLLTVVVLLVLQKTADCRPYSLQPVHIHFDSDGHVFSKNGPINHAEPVHINTNKFSHPLLKKSKFFTSKLPDWKGGSRLEKNQLLEAFGPVSLPIFNSLPKLAGHLDDVKPVTEHIEDDLKYDFRTGQHSF